MEEYKETLGLMLEPRECVSYDTTLTDNSYPLSDRCGDVDIDWWHNDTFWLPFERSATPLPAPETPLSEDETSSTLSCAYTQDEPCTPLTALSTPNSPPLTPGMSSSPATPTMMSTVPTNIHENTQSSLPVCPSNPLYDHDSTDHAAEEEANYDNETDNYSERALMFGSDNFPVKSRKRPRSSSTANVTSPLGDVTQSSHAKVPKLHEEATPQSVSMNCAVPPPMVPSPHHALQEVLRTLHMWQQLPAFQQLQQSLQAHALLQQIQNALTLSTPQLYAHTLAQLRQLVANLQPTERHALEQILQHIHTPYVPHTYNPQPSSANNNTVPQETTPATTTPTTPRRSKAAKRRENDEVVESEPKKRPKLHPAKDAVQCLGFNVKKSRRCGNAALMEYIGPRPLYCAEHVDLDPNGLYTKCRYRPPQGEKKLCREVVLKEFGFCHKHYAQEEISTWPRTEEGLALARAKLARVTAILKQLEAEAAAAKKTEPALFQRKHKIIPKYVQLQTAITQWLIDTRCYSSPNNSETSSLPHSQSEQTWTQY